VLVPSTSARPSVRDKTEERSRYAAGSRAPFCNASSYRKQTLRSIGTFPCSLTRRQKAAHRQELLFNCAKATTSVSSEPILERVRKGTGRIAYRWFFAGPVWGITRGCAVWVPGVFGRGLEGSLGRIKQCVSGGWPRRGRAVWTRHFNGATVQFRAWRREEI
jgi:hypothetical protein